MHDFVVLPFKFPYFLFEIREALRTPNSKPGGSRGLRANMEAYCFYKGVCLLEISSYVHWFALPLLFMAVPFMFELPGLFCESPSTITSLFLPSISQIIPQMMFILCSTRLVSH